MTTAVGPVAGPANGLGDGPDPQTDDEKTVQFINAEVLDPPAQGDMSFVKPFLNQSLAMAVEDARSFVQGAEQILLVALAKALNLYLTGGAGAATEDISTPNPTGAAETTRPAARHGHASAHEAGVKAIEGMLISLSNFHGSMAETAHKFRVDQ